MRLLRAPLKRQHYWSKCWLSAVDQCLEHGLHTTGNVSCLLGTTPQLLQIMVCGIILQMELIGIAAAAVT